MKQEKVFTYNLGKDKLKVFVSWHWIKGNPGPYLSVTGEVWTPGEREPWCCGCIHDKIRLVKNLDPNIAKAIKFHLVGREGPMHYIANTKFHASDRDHWGLRKGERRQIRHGGKEPCWKMTLVDKDDNEVDLPGGWNTKTAHGELSDLPVLPDVRLVWKPWETIGEGKERDIVAARSYACADWSEDHPLYLSDEQLVSDDLEAILIARLPLLVDELRQLVESFGFDWNMGLEQGAKA